MVLGVPGAKGLFKIAVVGMQTMAKNFLDAYHVAKLKDGGYHGSNLRLQKFKNNYPEDYIEIKNLFSEKSGVPDPGKNWVVLRERYPDLFDSLYTYYEDKEKGFGPGRRGMRYLRSLRQTLPDPSFGSYRWELMNIFREADFEDIYEQEMLKGRRKFKGGEKGSGGPAPGEPTGPDEQSRPSKPGVAGEPEEPFEDESEEVFEQEDLDSNQQQGGTNQQQGGTNQQQDANKPKLVAMSVEDAKKILGLQLADQVTPQMLKAKFDVLFTSNDPTKGGSRYLREKIEQAKKVVEEEMKQPKTKT